MKSVILGNCEYAYITNIVINIPLENIENENIQNVVIGINYELQDANKNKIIDGFKEYNLHSGNPLNAKQILNLISQNLLAIIKTDKKSFTDVDINYEY